MFRRVQGAATSVETLMLRIQTPDPSSHRLWSRMINLLSALSHLPLTTLEFAIGPRSLEYPIEREDADTMSTAGSSQVDVDTASLELQLEAFRAIPSLMDITVSVRNDEGQTKDWRMERASVPTAL
ncbi:hypothetical protein BD414DRAFT_242238 [Trametes punicea]|nr:hypothetical protein BD414DRAFT_242238 [Trametes punicea]